MAEKIKSFADFQKEARKVNKNFDDLSPAQQRADYERYKKATKAPSIYENVSRLPGVREVLSAPRDQGVATRANPGVGGIAHYDSGPSLQERRGQTSDAKTSVGSPTTTKKKGSTSTGAAGTGSAELDAYIAELPPEMQAQFKELTSGATEFPGELTDTTPIWRQGTMVRQGPTTPGDRHRPQAIGGGEKPASYYLQQFYKMTPNERTKLQQDMLAGGFYGEGVTAEDIQFGTPDAKSYAAYVDVLTSAARYTASGVKKDPSAVIAEGTGSPTGTMARDIPPISLTHPMDIRGTFEQKYLERVGHGPDEAAMAAFVDTYHSLERPGLEAARSAQVAGRGGETIQPPTLQQAAETTIHNQYGAEENAYQTIVRLHDFYNLLDSPVKR